jgi:hypothetical protein
MVPRLQIFPAARLFWSVREAASSRATVRERSQQLGAHLASNAKKEKPFEGYSEKIAGRSESQ